MAEKLKRKELIAQYEKDLDELDGEFMGYIVQTESMLSGLYDRERNLRDELAAANRSWAAAEGKLKAKEQALDAVAGERVELRGLLDIAEVDHAAANREVTKLRGQLSRARAALEPLRLALFPQTVKPLVGPNWPNPPRFDPKFPPFPGILNVPPQPFPCTINVVGGAETKPSYVGANYNPDLHTAKGDDLFTWSPKDYGPKWREILEQEDKVDRLNEAGYSCATEKAKIEEAKLKLRTPDAAEREQLRAKDAKLQAESYAGLS